MAATLQGAPEYVVCVDNKGYSASLELHKIYRSVPDVDAARDGDLRVVDESGEDYLFPARMFEATEGRPLRRSFGECVREIVLQIPAGQVTSYGQIAEMLGHSRATGGRLVANAMGSPGDAKGWHRVVLRSGEVSPRLPGGARAREWQRRMLQDDGVKFDDWCIVDLGERLWNGRAN